MREDEGTKERHRTRQPAEQQEEGNLGTVPRSGTSGARKKPHSNGASWTGTSGGTQWQADKHTEPGLEHPGKNETAGPRASNTGASGVQKPRDWTKDSRKRRVALERTVRGCTRGKRRRRQEKREASQGEHEQEQGMERTERKERS